MFHKLGGVAPATLLSTLCLLRFLVLRTGTRIAPVGVMHTLREFRHLTDLLNVNDGRDHNVDWILWQLRALYREIPGLALTFKDVQEAFGLDRTTCDVVLRALTEVEFLRQEGNTLLLST